MEKKTEQKSKKVNEVRSLDYQSRMTECTLLDELFHTQKEQFTIVSSIFFSTILAFAELAYNLWNSLIWFKN